MLVRSAIQLHKLLCERGVTSLGMVFARPVALLHTQFHARGSMVNGAGAHIGDLLFAQGRELAVVEIHSEGTPRPISYLPAFEYRRTLARHQCEFES